MEEVERIELEKKIDILEDDIADISPGNLAASSQR